MTPAVIARDDRGRFGPTSYRRPRRPRPRARPRSAARRPGRRRSRSPPARARRRSGAARAPSSPTIRPPLAPIGWPSATAPPFTFTRSSSAPSSLGRVLRDRRERLVDLDPRDVVDRLAGPLERDRGGLRRRAREVRDLVGDVPLRRRSSRAARSRAAAPTPRSRRRRTRRRRSRPARCPRSSCPPGRSTGFSAASFSSDVSRRGLSSASSSPTGTISSRKRPGVDRRDRALVRAERPRVLLLARDAELARDERRLLDHVPAVEGRDEAVVRAPGRSASRRRGGSRTAPSRARTARSTSTPCRP